MSHLLFPCGTYTIGNFHDICTYLCENDSREWKEVEDLTHGYSPPNSGIPHIMELLDGLSSTLNFLSLSPSPADLKTISNPRPDEKNQFRPKRKSWFPRSECPVGECFARHLRLMLSQTRYKHVICPAVNESLNGDFHSQESHFQSEISRQIVHTTPRTNGIQNTHFC